MSRTTSIAVLFVLVVPSIATADPEPPVQGNAAPTLAGSDAGSAAGSSIASPSTDEDTDLAALGLDPTTAPFDDKLNVYGFADFTWQYTNGAGGSTTDFGSGKLNVYLEKSFSPAWRALAEARLMYAPGGKVADPSDFDRAVSWGGVSIQRAYLEFDVTDYITIRAGHWLTPYGIWNVDHGSPAIISAYAPHVIGEALFPEHQTGLQVLGNKLVGNYEIGYAVTVSNGRSTLEATQSTSQHVAFGGRLQLEAPWAGVFKAGISAYTGRSTVDAAETVPEWQYDERDYAADAQWDHGPIHVQAEYIYHHRNPIDGDSPRATPALPPMVGAMSDPMQGPTVETNAGTNQGFYVLGAYRFDRLWHIMPFSFYEDWRPLALPLKIREINVGINLHPMPNVVLKAMYSDIWFAGSAMSGLRIFTTQASWVF